jgi:cob(I)alamin adenosyltransferase
MRSLDRKMKLLTTKLNALQSDLKTTKEIVEIAQAEIQKLYDERDAPNQPEQQPEQETKEISHSDKEIPNQDSNHESFEDDTPGAEKRASPEVRKMFKKIASICHPDKIHDMVDGPIKRKLEKLYQRARAALEDNDFFDMLFVTQELDLEEPEVTEEQISQVENKINTVKQELNHLESTVAWHWYFAKDEATRQKILKKVFEVLDERKRNNSGT